MGNIKDLVSRKEALVILNVSSPTLTKYRKMGYVVAYRGKGRSQQFSKGQCERFRDRVEPISQNNAPRKEGQGTTAKGKPPLTRSELCNQ